MDHKELCILYRLPIPLTILHLYSVFQDLGESLYDYLSDVLTSVCKDPMQFDVEVADLLERLKEQGIDFHPEGLARGLSYLQNHVKQQLYDTIQPREVKQLKAIHVLEPDTIVITFFSNGKDSLYDRVCHRARSTRLQLDQ